MLLFSKYLLIFLCTLYKLHGQRVVDVAQVHRRPAAVLREVLMLLLLLLLLLLLVHDQLRGTAAAHVGARGARGHEVFRAGVRRAVRKDAREQPSVLVDLKGRTFSKITRIRYYTS